MDRYEKLLKEIKELSKIENLTTITIKKDAKKATKIALYDLQKNHNHSWAVEMFERNKNFKDSIAIFFRGNKIKYSEMYSKVYEYACSLKAMGYAKDSEIPICMSNTPEFVYLFLASSLIGATVNVVGEWFNKNYLVSILNKSNSKNIFISDDLYSQIKDSINESNISNVVMYSITDSLLSDKEGNKINPYMEIDSKFHEIENKVDFYKNTESINIQTNKEFCDVGKNYKGKVVERCSLDDICSITYTSGTTKPGCPKGIKQSNRSYITLSRFKQSDVSGMPEMKNLVVQAHIPTYTHMQLSCGISDTLYCNCTLAMEPFYNNEFYPYSLLINKPNFVCSSVGFWIHLCKLLNYDKNWKNVKMPYLMIPTITGEGCSAGEEKFLNYTSRKHSFGTAKLPFPLAPVTFSMGGGTTESSGIFVTLYKALQEKKLNHLIKKESLGLKAHDFVDLEVLDENGKYCDIGKPGMLVANSPCNMIGYVDPVLDKQSYTTDAYGKIWLKLGGNAYKSDKSKRIKMKGRLQKSIQLKNGEIAPCYIIEDLICSDTKNIMSCTLTQPEQDKLVCHIEFQPEKTNNSDNILLSCKKRLEKIIDQATLKNLYIKVRGFDESYPLDPSGKRSITQLTHEPIDEHCILLNDIYCEKKQHQKVLNYKKSR